MTHGEWEQIWQQLIGLWPQWKTTTPMHDAWSRQFKALEYGAMRLAIQSHYEEGGSTKFQPDNREILKLATTTFAGAESEERFRLKQRFEALDPLGKARVLRNYHERMRDSAKTEEGRTRHDVLFAAASAQVRRLQETHGENCPPNYGPDTRVPEEEEWKPGMGNLRNCVPLGKLAEEALK